MIVLGVRNDYAWKAVNSSLYMIHIIILSLITNKLKKQIIFTALNFII